MTATVERRSGRTRQTWSDTFYRWACLCGQAGRWTRQDDTAQTGKERHDRACDVFEVGPWQAPWQSGHANSLTSVAREDGARLEFDPPNVLFIPGGARLRMENYSTDRPILAVERFSGEIVRYRMRVAAVEVAPL